MTVALSRSYLSKCIIGCLGSREETCILKVQKKPADTLVYQHKKERMLNCPQIKMYSKCNKQETINFRWALNIKAV